MCGEAGAGLSLGSAGATRADGDPERLRVSYERGAPVSHGVLPEHAGECAAWRGRGRPSVAQEHLVTALVIMSEVPLYHTEGLFLMSEVPMHMYYTEFSQNIRGNVRRGGDGGVPQ